MKIETEQERKVLSIIADIAINAVSNMGCTDLDNETVEFFKDYCTDTCDQDGNEIIIDITQLTNIVDMFITLINGQSLMLKEVYDDEQYDSD